MSPAQDDGLRGKVMKSLKNIYHHSGFWYRLNNASDKHPYGQQCYVIEDANFLDKLYDLFTTELAAAEERGRREMGEVMKSEFGGFVLQRGFEGNSDYTIGIYIDSLLAEKRSAL